MDKTLTIIEMDMSYQSDTDFIVTFTLQRLILTCLINNIFNNL